MREELEALRLERITLLREMEFVIDQANREAIRSASLERELELARKHAVFDEEDTLAT
jgi:hypothetical protein